MRSFCCSSLANRTRCSGLRFGSGYRSESCRIYTVVIFQKERHALGVSFFLGSGGFCRLHHLALYARGQQSHLCAILRCAPNLRRVCGAVQKDCFMSRASAEIPFTGGALSQAASFTGLTPAAIDRKVGNILLPIPDSNKAIKSFRMCNANFKV